MAPKMTTAGLRALKGRRPIVALTAYDALHCALADRAGADWILVGDSVGTALLGHETTVPVTLEAILHHTAAAARARPRALLVADIPFPVAHLGFDDLLRACARLMQEAGAEAVKIEAGAALAPHVARLVNAGVPVMGHVGLLPQRYHATGGYRKAGKTEDDRARLAADARALEEAGCFCLLGELIDPPAASALAQAAAVPFVGIGCGPDVDGQILVYTDVLGLTQGYVPAFAKRYAELGQAAETALRAYAEDVRERRWP